jgi:hypothetical protein
MEDGRKPEKKKRKFCGVVGQKNFLFSISVDNLNIVSNIT